MPLLHSTYPQWPDLSVEAVQIVPTSPIEQHEAVDILIRLRNRGQRAVADFWVDLYIDPHNIPSVNVPWQQLCASPWPAANCLGVVWHITDTVLPGATITVSTRSQINDSAYSHWPGYFSQPGPHRLYVQVDSFGPSAYGAVLEQEENNNLIGPINFEIIPSNGSLGLPPIVPTTTGPSLARKTRD